MSSAWQIAMEWLQTHFGAACHVCNSITFFSVSPDKGVAFRYCRPAVALNVVTAAVVSVVACRFTMSYAYPTPICDEGELKALAAMFKGNETAASAFCDKLGTRVGGVEEGLNTFFLTVMGALVFVMHAGFAMVRVDGSKLQICANAAACSCHFSLPAFKVVPRASSSWAIQHRHRQPSGSSCYPCGMCPANGVGWPGSLLLVSTIFTQYTGAAGFYPAVVCWCHPVQEHHEHSSADHSGRCSVRNLLVPDWVSLAFPLFSCKLSSSAAKAVGCCPHTAFLGVLASGLQSCAQACEAYQTTCTLWLDVVYMCIHAHSLDPAGAAPYAPVFVPCLQLRYCLGRCKQRQRLPVYGWLCHGWLERLNNSFGSQGALERLVLPVGLRCHCHHHPCWRRC